MLRLAIAAAAAVAAWLLPRRVAAARMALRPATLVDVLPLLVAGGLLLVATGRPLFAGLALLALGGGFALADWAKRKALREPVVFSDMAEFRHVFTHPHLYLPFAGPALVIGGALGAAVLGVWLLVFGPEMWRAAAAAGPFAHPGRLRGVVGAVPRAGAASGGRGSAPASSHRRTRRRLVAARPVRGAPRIRGYCPRRACPAPRLLSAVEGAGVEASRRGGSGRAGAVRILL